MDRSGAAKTLESEFAKIISLDRLVITAIDQETETYGHDFHDFLRGFDLGVNTNVGAPYSGSITSEVVRTGKSEIVNSDDPRLGVSKFPLTEAAFAQGYRSIIYVPLSYEEQIIGIMGISTRDAEYNLEDLAVADRIAALLAGALATFKITSERDRAQAALVESDGRFRQIADSILGVFWLTELEPRRLIYASANFENLCQRGVLNLGNNAS